MSSAEIQPRCCALKFRPPTLVLLYVDRSSGKQRRRSMPLRGISPNTKVEEFAIELRNHSRHGVFFRAIQTGQLHALLQRVKDGCGKRDSHTPTIKETYDTNDPPMLKTLSGGVITQQQTHTAATPPAQSALQTGALLLDLPPLITKQGVTNKEDISRLSLDDLLGPISEKNRLGEQGITAQDDTNPSGKEWRAPVLKPTTFSTEVDYSDDFSSQSNEDQDTADNSPSFNPELSTNDGRETLQGSETEQYHPHSLSPATIPNIITGDNYSEASGNDEQDLNRVSEQILAQEKKKMDNLFETNRIQPGETDWEYDKQKDFDPPQMESGWDSESSSTQEF